MQPFKAVFTTRGFQILGIKVFYTDRGVEFDTIEIVLMLETFGIECSLSDKSCLGNSVVDE